MATRTGSAVWEGTLKEGRGTMKLGSGAFEGLIHSCPDSKKRQGTILKNSSAQPKPDAFRWRSRSTSKRRAIPRNALARRQQ